MDDQQLVEGPPAKRAKVLPSLSNDSADYNIGSILDELPEELGSLGSNGSPTGDVLNGAREPPPLQQTVDPVLLKQQNQNLSKLLSSNGSSTPITNKTASPQSHSQTPMAGNARQNSTAAPGLNVDLNSLSNSPLTNSLSSPPHNVSIAKGMHMGNDLLGSPPCGGVGASSSMSSVGSMAPQGNAVNTKAAASQCLSSAAVNQMMNGPHLAMGAQSRSIAQSMQNVGSSFSQANMMGNAVANTLASAVGNMPFNSQQQGMGQPNMTSNQQQVIKCMLGMGKKSVAKEYGCSDGSCEIAMAELEEGPWTTMSHTVTDSLFTSPLPVRNVVTALRCKFIMFSCTPNVKQHDEDDTSGTPHCANSPTAHRVC
ncbi:hypothetical protein LSAT2_024685 [Lamellibrachia satsuma]|nr:hypothetical protein LSAT2_024685 [Lamellibrachia satsuma]